MNSMKKMQRNSVYTTAAAPFSLRRLNAASNCSELLCRHTERHMSFERGADAHLDALAA